MDRFYDITFGGRCWGMGVISLILLMGMIAAAVWFIPPNLTGATLVPMSSTKGNMEAGDLIFRPGGTSGIILSYSYKPWGGAISQPIERPCPRELAGKTPVRACCGLTGALEPSEIPMKDSPITGIGKSLLSGSGPLRLESNEMKRHLHRT